MKKYRILKILFLLIPALIGIFLLLDIRQRRKEVYDSLNFELLSDSIEYGDDISLRSLIANVNGNLDIQGKIDPYTTGKQSVTFLLSKEEPRYHFTVNKPVDIEFQILDSRPPVIEIQDEEVLVYTGSSYDPKENILHVYDPVDGKLDYQIDTSFDPYTSGEYEVHITTADKNHLITEKSFKIIVKARPLSPSEGYERIYDLLTNTYSFNKAAACGILANIRYESNFEPDVGDYYYGLCQWGGSRKDNLFLYCRNNNLDSSSIEGQLSFLIHELNTSYPSVLTYLKEIENSPQGAYDSGDYFCRYYEGAASAEGRGPLARDYFNS